MKRLILLSLIVGVVTTTGCKKDPELYEVNDVTVLPPTAGKNKFKTNQQYVAILHANLFQTAISANESYRASNALESIGDKELGREVLISNFMNPDNSFLPTPVMPTEAEMRADLDKFIYDTYERFLIRRPTEAEKTWFKNYIDANPNVDPELVYFSFALSNEYLFY